VTDSDELDPRHDDEETHLATAEARELERTQSRGRRIASLAISVGIIFGMLYFVVGLCA
jgi:hypothetical protein